MRFNEKQLVKTSDLGFAATLLSLGNTLIELERTDSRRVFFCLEVTREFQEIESSYWSKSLVVDAYTLGQNIKLLKNRLHAA